MGTKNSLCRKRDFTVFFVTGSNVVRSCPNKLQQAPGVYTYPTVPITPATDPRNHGNQKQSLHEVAFHHFVCSRLRDNMLIYTVLPKV